MIVATILFGTMAGQSKKTPLPSVPIARMDSVSGFPYVSRLGTPIDLVGLRSFTEETSSVPMTLPMLA